MKILIIDNFDSFTYNLKHYADAFCDDVTVKRNNEIELSEIQNYDAIIISPGPGLPKEAGISMEAIKTYASSKKILGVCLGHQAIAEVFGASLSNLEEPLHGIAVETYLKESEDALFAGIPKQIQTGRYHSWVVNPETMNETPLETIASDCFGQVQALKHSQFPLYGIQFHPESVLTEFGMKMMENWINIK
jgi:anthranilate synthase component 2